MKSPYYDYVLCGGKAKELCQIEGCCWWFVEIVECYVDSREADGLGFYAFPACHRIDDPMAVEGIIGEDGKATRCCGRCEYGMLDSLTIRGKIYMLLSVLLP